MPDIPKKVLKKIEERERALRKKYPAAGEFEKGGDENYHISFARHSDEMRRYFEEKLVLGYMADAELSDDFRIAMKSAKKARDVLETGAEFELSHVAHDFSRITWLLSRRLYGAFGEMTNDIEKTPSLVGGHLKTFEGFVDEYNAFLESLPEKIPGDIYGRVVRLTMSPDTDGLLGDFKRKGIEAYSSLLSKELAEFEESYKAGDRGGARKSLNNALSISEKMDGLGDRRISDEILEYSKKFSSYPTTRIKGMLGEFKNKLSKRIQASYASQ